MNSNLYYSIDVRFEERDALGKRMGKTLFVKTGKADAELMFDSVVGECKSRMVDATVDLIDLNTNTNANERLQRVIVDEAAARAEWSEFFPPLFGVRIY
jgi:hypothetical protein